jgi:hypothetical protein
MPLGVLFKRPSTAACRNSSATGNAIAAASQQTTPSSAPKRRRPGSGSRSRMASRRERRWRSRSGRGGGAYNPLGPRAWAGLVHTRRSVIAHRVGERIDMTTRPAAIHLSSSPTIVSCASPRVTACREFAGPRDILAPAGGAVRPQWLRPGTAALGKGRRSGLRPRVSVCGSSSALPAWRHSSSFSRRSRPGHHCRRDKLDAGLSETATAEEFREPVFAAYGHHGPGQRVKPAKHRAAAWA